MKSSQVAIILCLVVFVQCHIKEKLDIDGMSGDEIAEMALEARQNGTEESSGTSFNYGFSKGPSPLDGMDLPDEVRNEIEKAVKETMKKILEKAKTSKKLREVIRDELSKEAIKDDVDIKEMFGDFGWDIHGKEDETSEEDQEEFAESSYFQEEYKQDSNEHENEHSGKDEL